MTAHAKQEGVDDGVFIHQEKVPGNPAGPLKDLKFVIKDFTRVKNYPLTFGLKNPILDRSEKHSKVVSTLLSTGATLLGSTNMDVAALGYSGQNPYYGSTAHPEHSDQYVPGSSSGAAAAVAKNLCDFALTSDFAGSTRLPAASCSLFGLKLSPDSLPREGSILYDDSLDCFGLLARSTDILKQILSAIRPTQQSSEITKVYIPSKSELSLAGNSAAKDFFTLCEKIKFSLEELPPDFFSSFYSFREEVYPEAIISTFNKYSIDDPHLTQLIESLHILHDKKDKNSDIDAKTDEMMECLDNGIILSPTMLKSSSASSSNLNYYLLPANICGAPALNAPLMKSGLQITGAKGTEQQLLNFAQGLSN